ncbi:lipopolysaccharide biosynthesis protein [Mucilaginibacter sp.]
MTGDSNEVSRKEVKEKIKSGYLYLKHYTLIILLACFIGGILGVLYSIITKPLYTATSTFVLDDKGSGGGMGSYMGLASQLGISVGGGESGGGLFEGDNIIELYKSRVMLQKTLLSTVNFNGKKHLLIDRFIDAENLRKDWDKNPGLKNISFSNPEKFTIKQDSIITNIVNIINKKYLSVLKPDKKLSIIDVSVTYKDELFAQNFDKNLVANVNEFYINTKTKKSLQNVEILKFQSDSVKNILNQSLTGVASAIDASPNANPLNQMLKVPSQKRQVDVQTNAALYTEMVKNLTLAQITLRQEAPLIQIIDEPILPLDVKKIGVIKGAFIGIFLGFLLTCSILTAKKLIE